MSQTRIKGRVAFVTGANRGIGRAITEELLKRGAGKVYAADRRPETVADLAQRHGDRLVPVVLDVTDADHLRAAARTEMEVNAADIFPDPFAQDFGQQFHASPKSSEDQLAAMVAQA